MTSTQQEGDSSLASILADGRLSKADILVDKFKVEVATREERWEPEEQTLTRKNDAKPEDFRVHVGEEALWARGCQKGRHPLAPGSISRKASDPSSGWMLQR